jgi:IMP dehydrogenase
LKQNNYLVNNNTQKFFDEIHKEHTDLTFDDVLLKPRYSEILPKQTKVEGFFSRNIPLKGAICSAAMDTVTEHKLAAAIAMCGGIGVIHKNMTPEKQAQEVKKVKTTLHGRIDTPITFNSNQTLEEVNNIIKENSYSFNSFPIVENKKLVGLITNSTFKFSKDNSVKIKDVMIKDPFTASENTTLEEAFNIMMEKQIGVLPLVKKDKTFKGIYIFSDVSTIVKGERYSYNVDEKGRLRAAAAIGVIVKEEDWKRVDLLVKSNVDAVVLDTAHGHSKGVIETVEKIKKKYPDLEVVAGNVSTGQAVEKLIEAGVDGVKVGQGPGSICTTRIVTGSGSAQLSAIYDCAKASKGRVPIIADGGIRYSGDIIKAYAAGASCVMMGSLFASCIEAPGETIKIRGVDYRVYRGMGSIGAMKKHKESRERYGQNTPDESKLVAEGVEGKVLIKGPISFIFGQLIGGVQSGLGNNGAKDVFDLQKKALFRRISPAGLRESHPHDISQMQDAPNYQRGN